MKALDPSTSAVIPIERLFLCIDEDLVYNGALSLGCPQCGSRDTMPIARWLNRPETKPHPAGSAA